MRKLRDRKLLVLMAAAILVACQSDTSILAPRDATTIEVPTTGPKPERGCALVTVALQGSTLRSVEVRNDPTSWCGRALGIALAAPAEFDAARGVVRLPLALENKGAVPLGAPAQLYGWEDLLVVTSPGELARDRHARDYLTFMGSDSSLAPKAPIFTGARIWRFGAVLLPGGRSPTRWIEIQVKRGVQGFSALLTVEASRARMPAQPIIVYLGEGVFGAPRADTVAMVGDSVAYGYTPMAGFQNVQARLDGRSVEAAGVIEADTAPRVLTVTADRRVEIPSGAEGLFVTAQSVLSASDVPAAYQTFLDAAYAYAHAPSGDVEQRDRDVDDVTWLVFGPYAEPSRIAHMDSALAGWSFRIGPDSLGDPGGAPILSPQDTGVVATMRAPTGMPRLSRSPTRGVRSVIAAPDDTIDATVFLYVNGVATSSYGASITRTRIGKLVREIPGLASGKITVRNSYNRTFAVQVPPEETLRRHCIVSFASAQSERMGINSFPGYMSWCMKDSSYRSLGDLDLVESARQVLSILSNSNALEADAARLGNDIQRDRAAGRHVIVVAHSQGNLMANQAIHFIRQHPRRGLDSTCVGVVSLASPVSVRWDVPEHYLAPVRVDGDMIPYLGGSTYPVTSTELSRAILARAAKFPPEMGALVVFFNGWSTLHSVNDSYLKYEARDVTRNGIKQVYGACTVHELSLTPTTVQVGTRFAVGAVFTNLFGDRINRRMPDDGWASSDSLVAAANGDGGFSALKPGIATVTAARAGRTASARVTVLDPVPAPIVGTWSGNFVNETDPAENGPMTLEISGSYYGGASVGAHWTDTSTGQRYYGGMSGYIIVSPDGRALSGYMSYGLDGQPAYYSRYFTISTGSATTAAGISADGSGINTWQISLVRVIP